MRIKDAIVKRVKNICAERNISYTELERLSGVTPSTVYSMLQPDRHDISLAAFFDDPIFDDLPQEFE